MTKPRHNALEHFLALGFAQVAFRESLRDIEACLGAQPRLAYHFGFRSRGHVALWPTPTITANSGRGRAVPYA